MARTYLIDEYKIPEAACTLCYQGTDVKRFYSEAARKEEALRRYPTPEGTFPNFGCIGAYEKRKGQGFLVAAMADVVKEYPNAFLHWLVGKNGRDGDVEGELKAAVTAAGIEANVAFHPFTKEPMYVYEAIDAVVVSSLMEGLPNVLLEGLAEAMRVDQHRRLPRVRLRRRGRLAVRAERHGLLVTAMKKVCAAGRDGCARLGDAGCKFVNEKMDKNTQFTEFHSLFSKLTPKSSCDVA